MGKMILTMGGKISKTVQAKELLRVEETENPNLVAVKIVIEKEIFEALQEKSNHELYMYLRKILKRNAKNNIKENE